MKAWIYVTPHAIARYRERVKPHLSDETIISEVRRLCELAGEPVGERPEWSRGRPEGIFCEVCDGIAFVFEQGEKGLVCVTVLTRSATGEEIRQRRNHRKAAKRADRKARNAARNDRETRRRRRNLAQEAYE